MGEIVLLDQNTINKIAAGEVVERPAAVVKELVENAIDAGANAVTVEIKGGGIEFIRITDNGSGIEKEQVQIAFKRHATSKIRTAEDLLSVSSLGFRGEALASIGAVAKVELVTKTRGALTGSRYELDGGEEKTLEEIGCPEGTTFVVRNLFYNVPARRKFLKSVSTEASYINDLVERLAISNPGVAFKFMNNNQLKLQTSGNGNVKDIIYHIYGRDITANLLEVKNDTPAVKIEGFVAKPVVNRGNRNYMNYFINGRYIKSTIVNKAIEDAYKPYMMQHRYPMVALQFTIDSQFIDVNVHPAKLEIRFTNGQAVHQAIYQAVSDVLAGKNMIPEVSVGKEKKIEKTEVVKKAPEPFEQKRKFDEKTAVGKQIVEAAKVISQFEDIKKKQALLREESPYTVKKEKSLKPPKAWNGSAIPAEENVEETKNVEQNVPVAEKNGIQEQEKDGLIDSAKKTASAALEQFLAGKKSIKEEVSVEETAKTQNVLEKATEESAKIQNIQGAIGDATPNIESVESEHIWDKTNSKQEELFRTKEEEKFLSKEAKKHHKIIGQIFDTYWIVQYQDNMFLIDQHAAHEKVLFERTMKSLASKKITSQLLQPPMILSLSMREEQALKKHQEELGRLGFEIEAFGGREFSVRAVPANLFGVAQVELLTELLDSLTEEIKVKNADVILEKVASMSCKAAVKGNMKLSFMEAEALIDELMELENPYHCPHGRPVIVSMSKNEIEKKFKRIV